MESRGRESGDQHHRDRQPEVELYESQSVGIPLASGADEGYRAGLRSHDRQADHPPAHLLAGENVVVDRRRWPRPPQTVSDDADERED